MSKDIYSLLNTIQMPKQQFQMKNYKQETLTQENSTINETKLEKYEQQQSKIIQRKIFTSQSTQTDEIYISQYCQQQQQFQQQQQQSFEFQMQPHQSQVLLSLMESVDLDNFQPRQAVSISMKPFESYNCDDKSKEFLQFVEQQTLGYQGSQLQNLLQKYISLLNNLQINVDQNKCYMNSHLSFNEPQFEQQSPGWGITPTMKVQQSFLTDSLIV